MQALGGGVLDGPHSDSSNVFTVGLRCHRDQRLALAASTCSALQRRNRKDVPHYIEQAMAGEDWQECPPGITASEKAVVPRTQVQ
jgi:hypothetical protein